MRLVPASGVFGILFSLIATGGAAPAAPALAAADIVRLRSLIGHKVVVRGTVSRVEIQPKWEHRRIFFDGSEILVFLRRSTYGTGEGWDLLDTLPGKPVFIGGELIDYQGQLEILLHSPKQISANAAGIDLSKIPFKRDLEAPRGAKENTAEPALPGAIVPRHVPSRELEFAIERAEVRVAMTPLEDLKRDPRAPVQILSVSAVVEKSAGIGPAQIAIDPPLAQPSNSLLELSLSLPKKLRGWPMDKVIVLSMDGDETPPNVAVAVLIESMLTGREVPEDFVLCGGLNIGLEMLPMDYGSALNTEGKVVADAVTRSGDASAKPLRLVGGPARDSSGIDALRFGAKEAAMPIHSLQVIGCRDLDDLLAVIGIAERRGLAETLVEFDETQKVIRERGPAMLTNAVVRKRIAAALRALPQHVSAGYYRDVITGKLPPHRSLKDSARALERLLTLMDPPEGGGFFDKPKALSEAQAGLDELTDTLHPDSLEAAEALAAYFKDARPLYAKTERELHARDAEKMSELQDRAITLLTQFRALRK